MVLEAQAPIASAPLRAADLPLPEPGPGEIRVRVRACAVCRTDLHIIEGDLAARRLPLVPGHQVVGVVDALGHGASRFQRGDRVGVAWLRSTCGACRFCVTGRENLCAASTYAGWTHDGGYAEACCVPEGFAYALPDGWDDAEAAPLLCARYPMIPAHVTLQVARHWTCDVFVSTRDAAHRALARELGAAWVGAPGERLPAPVTAAIIFAPAGDLVPVALRDLDKGGTLALAGIYMTEVPAMTYEPHLFWEKTVQSVTANTRADGEALIAEAAAIPLRPRVTRHPLPHANRVLADLRRDRLQGTAVLMLD
jgi:propanol-preferring alcohol dehydrogenase